MHLEGSVALALTRLSAAGISGAQLRSVLAVPRAADRHSIAVVSRAALLASAAQSRGLPDSGRLAALRRTDKMGRVGMWRGSFRLNISVAASFVWRCLSGSTMTPFPHPAHRTGQADFPHPALGQDFTPLFDVRRHSQFPNPLWSL
jgi:hypothetical protein